MFQKPLTSNQRFALNVFLPSLYFVPLAVAYFSPKNFGFGYRWLVHAGLSAGMLGAAIWTLSMWSLGSSFAVLPGADELVSRGIYRYVRHPMYLGITLTLAGLMLACGSVFGVVYVAAVVLPLNFVRACFEDRKLEQQFGERFREMRKRAWF